METHAGPRLTSWGWIPSAVVILALLLLLVVPAEIDRRASRMREAVTAGERARTALNDFEAGLATVLLMRAGGPATANHAPSDSLDADLIELHASLHKIDDGALSRYDSLSRMLDEWGAWRVGGRPPPVHQGLELIARADTPDAYLAHFVDGHRASTLVVTRYYFVVPAILAPIAVLAM